MGRQFSPDAIKINSVSLDELNWKDWDVLEKRRWIGEGDAVSAGDS